MTPLESMLATKCPRCLNGVSATATSPLDERDCVVTAFSLAPKLGGDAACRVFGYPLADYNPNCKDDPHFVGPLTLRWNDDSESCVFDSDIHGYHGEMDSSAKIRGSGDAKIYICRQCGHNRFRVVVQFDYWDACDDLEEDDPDLPVQDYFCNVIFAGTCTKCGNANRILDMDL
jgi:hypothetical protein